MIDVTFYFRDIWVHEKHYGRRTTMISRLKSIKI